MAKRKKVEKTHPQSKEEGNKYDKVFQENMKELAPHLAEVLFGLKNYELVPLPQVKLQTTRQKDPDFLQIIKDERTPNGRLLHIEFEGQDTDEMDWRMQDYVGMAGFIHRMEIEQHLVFYGKEKPKNIKGFLPNTHYTFKYPIYHFRTTSFQEFLHKDKPQVVIFAILANPEGLTTGEIVDMILERLHLLEGDELAIRKFVAQLVMLSEKHNLQAETIKKIQEMMKYKEAFEYDPYYLVGEKRGEEKGMEKGIKKGIEKGMEKGMEVSHILAIRNMLSKGFDLPTIADILEVTQDYVLDIKKQLAKEPDVAAMLKKNADTAGVAQALNLKELVVEVIQKELGL